MLGRRQTIFSTPYFQFERFYFIFVHVMNMHDDLLCLPFWHHWKQHKVPWKSHVILLSDFCGNHVNRGHASYFTVPVMVHCVAIGESNKEFTKNNCVFSPFQRNQLTFIFLKLAMFEIYCIPHEILGFSVRGNRLRFSNYVEYCLYTSCGIVIFVNVSLVTADWRCWTLPLWRQFIIKWTSYQS